MIAFLLALIAAVVVLWAWACCRVSDDADRKFKEFERKKLREYYAAKGKL